jgi:hypothetical protein
MFSDPVEDMRKIEFMSFYRAIDKSMAIPGIHLYEIAIPPEEDVGGGESDALIAVDKSMVVGKGFHQRGGFFFDGIVVADLRTKNGGLYSALITDTMEAAEHFD